jgi:hypothetical protein
LLSPVRPTIRRFAVPVLDFRNGETGRVRSTAGLKDDARTLASIAARASIAGVRRFADLPRNARRYVGAMIKALLEVAYDGLVWPAALPNLRYLGVGPLPSQIIKDVPPTADLVRLA